ncbi:hypothetical protein LBWT_Y0370 (plasmid) [Leptolyngbya boryana IAM M-101]|nr:hypothetical protein LBWT_Y0370 [Leptolyngbya boryana IAM M-101]BAS66797.1 hypothetical protein LBDG_Y0370 [Leptolyngbya boryana dg5]
MATFAIIALRGCSIQTATGKRSGKAVQTLRPDFKLNQFAENLICHNS